MYFIRNLFLWNSLHKCWVCSQLYGDIGTSFLPAYSKRFLVECDDDYMMCTLSIETHEQCAKNKGIFFTCFYNLSNPNSYHEYHWIYHPITLSCNQQSNSPIEAKYSCVVFNWYFCVYHNHHNPVPGGIALVTKSAIEYATNGEGIIVLKELRPPLTIALIIVIL